MRAFAIPRRLPAALVAAFFLAGCANNVAGWLGAADAELESMIGNIKRVNDAEAKLLRSANCAIDLGAYFRLFDETEQRALAVLCGGPSEAPVTAEDVRRARELIDILKPDE